MIFRCNGVLWLVAALLPFSYRRFYLAQRRKISLLRHQTPPLSDSTIISIELTVGSG